MNKSILALLITLSIQLSFSQNGTLKVEMSNSNPVGEALDRVSKDAIANKVAKAYEIEAEAEAAKSIAFNESLKNNYSKITTDNLINNSNNYKYLVVQNIAGWMPENNKASILEALIGAKKYIIIDISTDYNSKGKEIKNEKKIPVELINNKEVLFLNWLRESQGDLNRITILTIKNSTGKVIYESFSKNLSHNEILRPLISNYVFSKDQIIIKIKDLKEYLNLGIINKEEYDLKISELKPLLLESN